MHDQHYWLFNVTDTIIENMHHSLHVTVYVPESTKGSVFCALHGERCTLGMQF